jgi:hypothetical protein
MALINSSFGGKMNLDDAPFRMPKEDYLDALNITRDSQAQGQDRFVSNILGNRQVAYTLPSGQNKTIGFYPDKIRNRGYYFIWNSNNKHSILYYDADNDTIVKILESKTDSNDIDILEFNPTYKILSINIFYRDDEGDILYFNDGNVQPKAINVETTYAIWAAEYLDVAKAPPQMPPKCVYENDTDVKVNNLRNALFQFRYRFVYANFEKSVWSSASILPLPNQATLNFTDNTFTNNARISISMSTGSEEVIKIELAFRQTKNSITSGWLLVDVFNKSELSINDNSIYTFNFYNDGLYAAVDPKEANLLQDLVPQKANAQELLNGNTLLYGGITEGFPAVDTDLLVSVNQAADGFYFDYNGLLFFAVCDGVDSGVEGTVLKIYVFGTGTNTAGVVTTLNNAEADFVINAVNGAGSSIGVTVSNATASVAVATLLGNISTALQGNGWTQTSLSGNILTMNFAAGFTLYSSGTLFVADAQENTSLANAFESAYEYGLQYFDEKGRTNGTVTNVDATFNTPQNTGVADFCQPRLTISHRPPTWAKYYQVVRSNNNTYGNILHWVSQSAYSDSVANILGVRYAYVGIDNIKQYNEQIESTQNVVSYAFKQGDRVRFLSRYSADGTSNSITVRDYEVLGVVDSVLISGEKKIGTYIKIYYPTADISGSFAFDGTANFQNYEVLIYNYAANETDNQETYYEFGKCFGIGNYGTVTAYHIGFEQTQSEDLVTPAIVGTTNGDFFWRKRSVPVGQRYNLDSPQYEQSGPSAYSTPNITIPATITVASLYEIKSSTHTGAGLGVGDYPTAASTDYTYINNSATAQIIRVKGRLNSAVFDTNGGSLQMYGKVVPTVGNPQITNITPLSNSLQTNISYEFEFDTLIPIPVGAKFWFVIFCYQTQFMSISELYIQPVFNREIAIIEASFSDSYRLVTNSNGRPSVIEENAQQAYYPTLVRFGQAYQANTSINGTNRFYPDNFDEYDRGFGDIMRLHVRDRYCKVYQKFKVGNVPVLTQIVKDVAGNPLQANSDQLINKIQYYAGDFGIGDAAESLAWNNFADYFVDDYRGVVCRLSQDGISPISLLYLTNAFFVSKLKNYRKSLNNDVAASGTTYSGDPCVYGVFDAYTNKYIIALEQITRYSNPTTISFEQDAYTISFDEPTNTFESFYSYNPEMMGCLNTLLITFKDGGLWKHDSETYCNFYGTQYDASITGVFNDNSLEKKSWNAITQLANGVWECPLVYSNVNTYGSQRQETVMIPQNFIQYEGNWSGPILRDSHSIGGVYNGNQMKGNYLVIKFLKQNASSFIYLNGVSVLYKNSALTSK